MKRIIIVTAAVLFCFISAPSAIAQIEAKVMDKTYKTLEIKNDIEGLRNNLYQNIEGDPYLFEEFAIGYVKLKDGGIYKGLLRFDKYANEIHFKKENNIYALALPKEVEYIEIETTRFIYSKYKLSEKEKVNKLGAYFIVVVDDDCKLLEEKRTIYKEGKPSNGIAPAKPAAFIDKNDSYFIKIDNQPAIKIKNSTSLISILADKEAEISKFIKSENKSAKNREDLIAIVNYYNTLIKK